MKIQLDTTKKTIKIDEDVKITKLMATIKKLLPHGEWMDFTLQTNTTIEHWSYPYIWRWSEPVLPWYTTTTCCNNDGLGNAGGGGSNTLHSGISATAQIHSLDGGVYNIEVK